MNMKTNFTTNSLTILALHKPCSNAH